jgi:hypothetical protein
LILHVAWPCCRRSMLHQLALGSGSMIINCPVLVVKGLFLCQGLKKHQIQSVD